MNRHRDETPATVYGDLFRVIRNEGLMVEPQLDIAWVYLRKPGFTIAQFGDVNTRDRRLGKWMTSLPRDRLLTEAKQLLPLIHSGDLMLAKFTNICNRPQATPKVAVYCLDRDETVSAVLQRLGWRLRWKYNYETFGRNK